MIGPVRLGWRRVRWEPWERMPVYNCAVKGLRTTPMVGSRERVKPIDMATYGIPWTKFVVPIGPMLFYVGTFRGESFTVNRVYDPCGRIVKDTLHSLRICFLSDKPGP